MVRARAPDARPLQAHSRRPSHLRGHSGSADVARAQAAGRAQLGCRRFEGRLVRASRPN